jgi:hypothetical protein
VKVTFVTGVSGAGKTTLETELIRRRSEGGARDYAVLGIDERGTPDAGHLDWLRYRAAQLLYDSLTIWGDGQDGVEQTVICGIVWPHAVIDSNAWPAAEDAKADVRFVLLDLPHKLVKERLSDRLAGKKSGEQRAILRYNQQLAGVLRRQVTQQRNGGVLNVRHMTPADVAGYVTGGGW